ncbi:carbohydrate kinase family protein [Caproiciproducens sp.]|uniref:carbohydrate kinase family protein n=1 Tax=Caproiciproducens sp. TaxID=1954376 RepID=UPI00289B8DD2|nr:carbohydrate kinase [Caproiciproducens sp.]
MYDVVAVGELLIDFTPNGSNDQGCALFARNPGGAPANVLAANSRLGGKTAFIGKVGRDAFGDFLKVTLERIGICTDGLAVSETVNTTLAFVQLDERGDRSFSFYRKPGADMMLEKSDISDGLIKNCRILHFGSVSLTDEPSRQATFYAVKLAKASGKIISYDPNYRPLLWSSEEEAKREMLAALTLADIVKVSREELSLLTGDADLELGAKKLAQYGASLILVSLGAKGAFYSSGETCGMLPAYDVKTVDTTGAGDAFLGAVHYRLRNKSLDDIKGLSGDELEDIVSFANAAGSLATTRKGAIPAMPSLEQVQACLREIPKLK